MSAEDRAWATDPVTLKDVVLDRTEMESRLSGCPVFGRVWILGLLDPLQEAKTEGRAVLERSRDKFRPLLALASACRRGYEWQEAARLQEAALRRAHTPVREALVRHQIGRRLFYEARYREAAAEFEWARDLYRSAGQRSHLAEASARP